MGISLFSLHLLLFFLATLLLLLLVSFLVFGLFLNENIEDLVSLFSYFFAFVVTQGLEFDLHRVEYERTSEIEYNLKCAQQIVCQRRVFVRLTDLGKQ